jgi:hypothetical protein
VDTLLDSLLRNIRYVNLVVRIVPPLGHVNPNEKEKERIVPSLGHVNPNEREKEQIVAWPFYSNRCSAALDSNRCSATLAT